MAVPASVWASECLRVSKPLLVQDHQHICVMVWGWDAGQWYLGILTADALSEHCKDHKDASPSPPSAATLVTVDNDWGFLWCPHPGMYTVAWYNMLSPVYDQQYAYGLILISFGTCTDVHREYAVDRGSPEPFAWRHRAKGASPEFLCSHKHKMMLHQIIQKYAPTVLMLHGWPSQKPPACSRHNNAVGVVMWVTVVAGMVV